MAIKTPEIIQTITNTPVPMMLEQLGVSIAKAQAALDANSIKMAKEMSSVEVKVGDENHNLISLGFAPTFYAFTEATIEVKMEMSIAESEESGGSFSLDYGSEKEKGTEEKKDPKKEKSTSMFGLSVSAHYARKFSVSAEASSSIAAKIVSLPAPDIFNEILQSTITPNQNTNK